MILHAAFVCVCDSVSSSECNEIVHRPGLGLTGSHHICHKNVFESNANHPRNDSFTPKIIWSLSDCLKTIGSSGFGTHFCSPIGRSGANYLRCERTIRVLLLRSDHDLINDL